MTSCGCASYEDLPLDRKAISKRAGQYKEMASHLDVLLAHSDGEHVLLRCPMCGQHWQKGSAWNWGAREYIFKVPEIEPKEWSALPFVDPDEVLVFAASIDRFLSQQEFVATDQHCRQQDCVRNAVKGLAFCLHHHVEQLQNLWLLPKTPIGRWWGAYERFGPAAFDRAVAMRVAK
jgi:hypothetical protein